MAILNKYKKWNPILKVNTEKVWDFIISNKKKNEDLFARNSLCAFINISDPECISANEGLFSYKKIYWDGAINNGITLKNIGLTAIDSGYISFSGDNITNEDFLNILTNSTLSINANDLRLHLKPVNSSNNIYDFSYSYCKDNDNSTYLKLNGGFFQGFFKLHEEEYQVLPSVINDGWFMEFTLRPRDYDITHNSLNGIHKDNKGIFFYIGTRSENKFLTQYNYDLSTLEKRDIETHNDFLCYNYYNGYYFENFADIDDDKNNYDESGDNDYFLEDSYLSDDESSDYFIDNSEKEYFSEMDYLIKERNILNEEIFDTNGTKTNVEGYYEIKTDNKFLFFNNSKEGFTADKWTDDVDVILTDHKTPKLPNLYLYLNNNTDGFTADEIDELYKSLPPEKLDFGDITNNAFALRITDDGCIGYRYLIEDCVNDYKVIEEYSKPNIIRQDEWNNIGVSFTPINGDVDDCGREIGKRTMKIKIYIGGKLKFISKEIPMFNFREINEYKTKQEGVPYNISLGGGTMSLCNSMWLNYYHVFEYIFPLEKYFGGSFVGDIKSFKFYSHKLDYSQINSITQK